MTAKLCVLVALTLGLQAFASIDSGSAHSSETADFEDLLRKFAPEADKLQDAALAETDLPKSAMAELTGSTGPKMKALEDAVTDLVMSKAVAAFGATPFGKSVDKIIALIEKEMIPQILAGHKDDQKELNELAAQLAKCGKTKRVMVAIADKSKTTYLKMSPLHRTCRTGEAGLFASKEECYEELADRKTVMKLKCKEYAMIDAKLGNQNSNSQIVKKGGGESTETYINRISATFCGQVWPKTSPAAKCGSPKCGFRCTFQCAKVACEKATRIHKEWTAKCKKIQKQYDTKKLECNNLQDQMDGAACKRAVNMKDACETYAECYTTKRDGYKRHYKVVKGTRPTEYKKGITGYLYHKQCVSDKDVKTGKKCHTGNELDRHAEWRGLRRMQCLMAAFKDGKVSDGEIKRCKKKVYSINHLKIKYPVLYRLEVCSVPKLYPTTGEYKKAEFAPLPTMAKVKEDANECTGVLEISTTPASGSPATCKCDRVTMNGPYSPGPMVKCINCLDARKSGDKISCPAGTKLFAPASREDWKTFVSSARPLRNPHWIIDVTRPQNGCGGCTRNAMNSGNSNQKSWTTADDAPWWLRSTRYNEPNGDYHANCYLDLWRTPKNENSVTWNDGNCNYHSKSYYCQIRKVSLRPKAGSPRGCLCQKVELTGRYTPGLLIKCKGCLDIRKSTQKNSCPKGMKIFAPRTRADWKTFIESAQPLRSPHWIIDVTRPANGCGGCTRHSMNSANAAQKTWRTSDGSAWWLRSTTYSEPNGDYSANCYLDLWRSPPNENSVTWNDGRCNYHANSYYCQLAKKR